MAADTTRPDELDTQQLLDVLTALKNGDLTARMGGGSGIAGQIADTLNATMEQLQALASDTVRLHDELGTQGRLGGQSDVGGLAGSWKDMRDSLNGMSYRLTHQLRSIQEVVEAVAAGNFARKIAVDAEGEMRELRDTINAHVDLLNRFAGEITRTAREIGTEGRLGSQAEVSGAQESWLHLVENVNFMAANITGQIRSLSQTVEAIANGNFVNKADVECRGEVLQLKDTINRHIDMLNSFAMEITRVSREIGTESRLGCQAEVPGASGTWRDLTDNVNHMASNLTEQIRDLGSVSRALAEGDYSRRLTCPGDGEFLQLKNHLNQLSERLSAG